MGSIKWDDVVQLSIPVFKEFVEDRRVIPTLRTIYYALVSKGIIPNTKTAYKGLSTAFVKARQDGIIDWSWMVDETRKTKIATDYGTEETPEDYADGWVDYIVRNLKGYLQRGVSYSLKRWRNQPKYVEIWVEKQALMGTFEQWLEQYVVNVTPIRGYSSWTCLKDSALRLKGITDREITIAYFGDFDPSGVDIERFVTETMKYKFGIDCTFKRYGVTKDQIEQYNLPTTPEDSEEMEKLQRDSRYNNWEYGNYRVELDALLAFVPDEFKRIIESAVKDNFDEEIYEQVQQEQSDGDEIVREKVKNDLPRKVQELLDKFNDGDL